MQFKQCAISEFLTAEKIPPVDILCCMQAVCGDKCVDVRSDLGYNSLSKKECGQHVCGTKQVWGGQ